MTMKNNCISLLFGVCLSFCLQAMDSAQLSSQSSISPRVFLQDLQDRGVGVSTPSLTYVEQTSSLQQNHVSQIIALQDWLAQEGNTISLKSANALEGNGKKFLEQLEKTVQQDLMHLQLTDETRQIYLLTTYALLQRHLHGYQVAIDTLTSAEQKAEGLQDELGRVDMQLIEAHRSEKEKAQELEQKAREITSLKQQLENLQRASVPASTLSSSSSADQTVQLNRQLAVAETEVTKLKRWLSLLGVTTVALSGVVVKLFIQK